MTTETVNLLAPGNPPSEVIGTAELIDLPDDRYPEDLKWLAPFIVCNGRYFAYAPAFSYGAQGMASYVEQRPIVVQRVAFTQAQQGPRCPPAADPLSQPRTSSVERRSRIAPR
jgi:hypothetical protein